jgi:lysophospholipase L1-like esterase
VAPRFEEYVAIGDSYAAGPFIANTEANTGCFRSDHNYASLLAESLDIDTVHDVTCSGAMTQHVDQPQTTIAGPVVPPQRQALSADTDLVTVGLGGNDFNLFGSGLDGGWPAKSQVVPRIGENLRRVLRDVHAKAPKAEVVLVGYPRLVDPGTSCPAILPFTGEQIASAYDVQRQLNDAMREAAADTDTTFVDLLRVSEGHGICSDDPWVNGQENLQGKAAAYHPFAVEMEAAALEIERALAS